MSFSIFSSTIGRFLAFAGGLLWFFGVFSVSVRADIPNLFHFYEEQAGSEYAVSDSGGGFQIHLAENAAQNSDKARFGKGSLLIKGGLAWETMIEAAEWEPFRGEIRQMTISAWVRPSGLESFVVFWRLPSALEWPGFFQFSSLGGEKNPLYFAVTGPGAEQDAKGEQHQVLSTQSVSFLPDEWNHLALTFNEGEVTFYVNGERVGAPVTVPIDTIPAITNPQPSMKAAAGSAQPMFLDDFGLFGSTALTADEVFLVYQDGLDTFVKNHPDLN